MKVLPSADIMYRALVERDTSFEGVFYAGITTTGIFCRPTCPARKPREEHVEYFSSVSEALHAGYRPCKRCHPMEANGHTPAWVRALLGRIEGPSTRRITDAGLRAMSIEPAQARRYFKRHFGMTFHAYHRARRLGLALADVRNRQCIDTVGYVRGFESSSGFRDAFARVFGEPPGRGRSLECLTAKWIETPLGAMLAIANDAGLCLLEFVDRRGLESQLKVLRRRFNGSIVPGENEHLRTVSDELARYFEGSSMQFTVSIISRGTPFQEEVWKRLRAIPPGETLSYAQLAHEIGFPRAQHAVGRANGDNRIAVIIPCHRVVRSDGALCGYGGGVWRKRWLLEHERMTVASHEA